MVEELEVGGFFSESLTKRRLFATVHDAVLYCLNHRGATSLPRYEPSLVSLHTYLGYVRTLLIHVFCEDKRVQLVNYCLYITRRINAFLCLISYRTPAHNSEDFN